MFAAQRLLNKRLFSKSFLKNTLQQIMDLSEGIIAPPDCDSVRSLVTGQKKKFNNGSFNVL